MKRILVFFLLTFLISCAHTPEWTQKTPFDKENRRYFTGAAVLGEKSVNQARKEALLAAREKIAQEMSSYVKSAISKESEIRQEKGKKEKKSLFRSFSTLETTQVLKEVKTEKTYRGEGKYYVQISIPLSELEPTLENMRERNIRLAQYHFERGKVTRALDLYESAFLLGEIGERDYIRVLNKMLLCYEGKKNYQEALEEIDKFLSRFPQSQARRYFEKEKERLRTLRDGQAAKMKWKAAVLNLQITARQHQRKKEFAAHSLKDTYQVGQKIDLILQSSKKRPWHVLWIDDDGIYLLDSLIEGKDGFPPVQGQLAVKLTTSTKAGLVTLVLISPPQKLNFPVSEISKEKFKTGDLEERTKLRKLMVFLQESKDRQTIYTDLVKIKFK